MLLRLSRMLVLATSLACATTAWASGDSPSSAATAAVANLRRAEQAYQAAQRGSEELAHRITAMKRIGTSSALEQLLQQSQLAEKALAEKAAERNLAKKDAEKKIAAALESIRATKNGLRGALTSKNPSERQEATKKLRELEGSYNELQGALAAANSEPSVPRAWKQYEVKIDPLDGPAELREKADFLEDLRDKFLKKKREVEARLSEARQEREIARLAKDFATETTIFDEQSVPARVVRTSAGSSAEHTLAVPNETSGAGKLADSGGARGATSPPPNPTQNPSTGLTSPTPPPANGDFAGQGSPSPAQGGTPSAPVVSTSGDTAARAVATGLSAPVLPKQIDLNGLVNLSSKDLDKNLDVASLEALLKDLGQLEGFLAAHAGTIRQRAKTLEVDEAHAHDK
ncbi:MAG: hypothetical protein U1E65_18305 [Myxococcota bacterium]